MLNFSLTRSTATVWIDLTDLIAYFDSNSRVTGIQRVCLELYGRFHELSRLGNRPVRFCAIDLDRAAGIFEIPSADALLFLASAGSGSGKIALPNVTGFRNASRSAVRLLEQANRKLYSFENKVFDLGAALQKFLPPRIRLPSHLVVRGLRDIFTACILIGIELVRWPVTIVRNLTKLFHGKRAPGTASEEPEASGLFKPAKGDILLNFGAPWLLEGYWAHIAKLQRERGFRAIALVYDVIPIMRPEWFSKAVRQSFREHLGGALANCAALFVLSDYTQADLVRLSQMEGFALPPVATLRIGRRRFDQASIADAFEIPAGLQDEFVLCVSTIDIRKNQRLLFDVWAEFRRRHGHEATPQLVLVGKLGYLNGDLQDLMANSDNLSGKILVIGDASDALLHLLYTRCMFTVLPSLYEGWGLPIGESLSYGKYCVAAAGMAVSAAASDLIDYFDPLNFVDAYAAIERPIVDRAFLTGRANRILQQEDYGWDVAAKENWNALQGLINSVGVGEARVVADKSIALRSQ